ncbi:MAG TPA: LytTR family DNA-binding domain-containing protein [Flavisolibacter sp.]|jgi:two-component system LytT family response regulator
MIHTIIVDDEPASIDVISELSNQLATDISIVGTASNGLEAIQLILEKRPQLVFLDIDMPKMNGLDVIEKIPKRNMELIFTTGSSAYALKAFKVNAADYLLKPIDPAEFLLAVEKVRVRLSRAEAPAHMANVNKLQLPTLNGMIYLDEALILHVEGMGSYSNIVTTENEKIVVSRSIGQLELKLNPELFFRCHNSHIVNLGYVTKFISKDGYFVILKNSVPVEVSRRSKDSLLQKLASMSK